MQVKKNIFHIEWTSLLLLFYGFGDSNVIIYMPSFYSYASLFFYFNIDMIDQVLGFGRPAAVRRKRTDNASESSTKQEVTDPVTMSPARTVPRRINAEEQSAQNKDQQEKIQVPVQAQPLSRSRSKGGAAKIESRPEPKSQIVSQQRNQPKQELKSETRADSRSQRKTQIKSQVAQPKAARAPSATKSESQQEIASPAVKNLRVAKVAKNADQMQGSVKLKQSIRLSQMKDESSDTMYKLKLLGFLIVSLLLILNAMTPSRKCVYKRR